MTITELVFFTVLVLAVLALGFLLGKALGRAQAIRLEIHPEEKHLDEQAKEKAKALNERVLRLTANVRVHLDDSTTFSDLVDFGDEDEYYSEEEEGEDGPPD